MKEVKTLLTLKELVNKNNQIWLLLFKKGSPQSDCAISNYKEVGKKVKNSVLLFADVNLVDDIHPEYEIKSVPTLLGFTNGNLKQIVKGCHDVKQFQSFIEGNFYSVSQNQEKTTKKNVVVYTTPTCTWCTTVKRHLDENRVSYREINVAADQNAADEMVRKSGQQGVPQIDINGQIIVGFDKNRINQLLNIN